ncbi:hypothetical protein FM107_19280 [Sphingobacterium sp. JB170]|nr:hypothetical protein FM107_19280 [Sphingobacterium sp. JB170]
MEFGTKINLKLVSGFALLDNLEWDAYNEAACIPTSAQNAGVASEILYKRYCPTRSIATARTEGF